MRSISAKAIRSNRLTSYEVRPDVPYAKPWPNKRDLDAVVSHPISLDGGGKEIVDSMISNIKGRCEILEIGVFLGASALRWLTHKNTVVYGVDLFGDGWGKILRNYESNDKPWMKEVLKDVSDIKSLIASVEKHGSLILTQKNLFEYRKRFIAIKGQFQKIAYELSTTLDPHIIYLDADKSEDILRLCLELFPNAQIAGDDWTWGKEQGYPIQTAVKNLCSEYGLSYESSKATWRIIKE